MKVTKKELLEAIRYEFNRKNLLSEQWSTDVFTRRGDPYEYKVISGRWHTRKKGRSSVWIDLEPPDDSRRRDMFVRSVNILNTEFPGAAASSPMRRAAAARTEQPPAEEADIFSIFSSGESQPAGPPGSAGPAQPEEEAMSTAIKPAGGDSPPPYSQSRDLEREVELAGREARAALEDEETISIPDNLVYKELRNSQAVAITQGLDLLREKAAGTGGSVLIKNRSRGPAVYAVKQLLSQFAETLAERDIASELSYNLVSYTDLGSGDSPQESAFDNQAYLAVRSFQEYLGLSVDGKVGRNTSRALVGITDSWAAAATRRIAREEGQEAVLRRLAVITGREVTLQDIPIRRTTIADISSKLQSAGIRNVNMLAGILGNIEHEAGARPNIAAMGDDVVNTGRGRIATPETIEDWPESKIKKPIAAQSPVRAPSLYRSFGLVQWNISGGAGEEFLSRNGVDPLTATAEQKLSVLLDLDKQTGEIARIARDGQGRFDGWGEAMADDTVEFDEDAAAEYAHQWAEEFERCSSCVAGPNQNTGGRQMAAKEIGGDLFGNLGESVARKNGMWIVR